MELSKQGSDPLATLSTLTEFYAQGKYSDVKIEIGGEIFPCQRSILAAISKYFDAMFSNNFKEKDADTIVIHDIDASTFREILQLMSTGEIRITDSNVYSLLVADDFLQLRNGFVEERCFEYLQERTSNKSVPLLNTFEILSFSHVMKKERIVHLLYAHVFRHFIHFVKDTKFLEISFEILNGILSECHHEDDDEPMHDDELGDHDDSPPIYRYARGNARFRGIISWLGYSRAERSRYRNKLMSYIDTSNLSVDYALSLMNNYENFADQAVVKHDDIGMMNFLESIAALDPRSETAFAMGRTITICGQNFSSIGPNFEFCSSRSIHGMEYFVTISGEGSAGLLLDVQFDLGSHDAADYILKVHFTVMSQKEGKEDFIENFQADDDVYDTDGTCRRFEHLINSVGYDYLVEEKNGYIKNDCVTFQLRLSFL